MDNYNFSKPRDNDVVVRKVKDWNMYKFLNHRLEVKLPGMRFIFIFFSLLLISSLPDVTYVRHVTVFDERARECQIKCEAETPRATQRGRRSRVHTSSTKQTVCHVPGPHNTR